MSLKVQKPLLVRLPTLPRGGLRVDWRRAHRSGETLHLPDTAGPKSIRAVACGLKLLGALNRTPGGTVLALPRAASGQRSSVLG